MDSPCSNISLKKSIVILISQFCIACILFMLYSKINLTSILFKNNFEELSVELSNHSQVTILLWTWPFGDTFPLNQCPLSINISGCFYTQNRLLYSYADAVILHHRDVCCSKKKLPHMPRPPNQYWVWFNLESPSNTANLDFMNNLVNLTMSYRSDSDIFAPYGWLEQNDKEVNFTIPTKNRLVAWAISNWNSNSRRVRYYEQLKQHVSIDVFGQFHRSLPNSEHQQVLSQYKFYLAFENSVHEDYITEKLWKNSLMAGCVPIVLGPPRANYERFIPKDSFIHVEDFSTAQELAAYILQLDKDDKAYQKYFHWRRRFHSIQDFGWDIHYCKICKALKKAPKHKTIASIADWYK
ncbi:3-galactosyl-N-acetylglucosaminide 4-alpha-L-fucosyltransferase FUT3-like [Rana temporaria]|uniref:3-galactosyl-N-acetylglucosaminide 4-alpha-L-fucosyltransferase FUT3-like n=1 Tax=Rana temporaria TaxID=8407 RepID=UPI001AAD1F86|nr:3-galactosyl-N-acetylglucosaminide 4-alpha-L-fucosyltransferase FUT3-like [Rana temporaria]XP_040184533.1 3-galactosyl-N-acetylglucosaminide 4-alpha-L-fucosyltransferase FUT3-like [Rana temporaria]XP_040184534.1 3-galactosyl-N-acetylglucosaminide 4-alpha-L-fucosyltransferase FUT3-like [Rana temporaria]XP_040184535.1 3-galactosyl-N-acetylglucosaminide 4-alpha-L-fucosyltransferase FUT3-like [Rana temporaria]